jgi:hypothetical protein
MTYFYRGARHFECPRRASVENGGAVNTHSEMTL